MNETHSDGVFSIKPKNRKITVYKITAVTTSRFVIYSTVFVGLCNCAYTSTQVTQKCFGEKLKSAE